MAVGSLICGSSKPQQLADVGLRSAFGNKGALGVVEHRRKADAEGLPAMFLRTCATSTIGGASSASHSEASTASGSEVDAVRLALLQRRGFVEINAEVGRRILIVVRGVQRLVIVERGLLQLGHGAFKYTCACSGSRSRPYKVRNGTEAGA